MKHVCLFKDIGDCVKVSAFSSGFTNNLRVWSETLVEIKTEGVI